MNRDQFHSALFIVGCASGNGGLLDALLPYAHAGLLDQVKAETATVICEKYGLKSASLSVLQKMPKSTWAENGKQRPNPASTIYTYIQALKKCGNDFAAMAALTPSGIVKANKPEAEKKTRKTSTDTPINSGTGFSVADAIAAIREAHKVGALCDGDYSALRAIVEVTAPLNFVQRVDSVPMLAH